MGLVNTEIFTAEQNALATIGKVLSHPARIAILQHLLKVNSCIGGDLVEEIQLTQPTISKHLKELKSIGIIKGTIEGTSVNYCIDAVKWRALQKVLNTMFDNYVLDQNCGC